MKIDLSKQAVVGATLVSDKGWRHVITKDDAVCFQGGMFIFDCHSYWLTCGTAASSYAHRIGNIVEVIPPAFDWATVKRGMAFKDCEGHLYFYAGIHLKYYNPEAILFMFWDEDPHQLWPLDRDFLTRAPEHDKVTE